MLRLLEAWAIDLSATLSKPSKNRITFHLTLPLYVRRRTHSLDGIFLDALQRVGCIIDLVTMALPHLFFRQRKSGNRLECGLEASATIPSPSCSWQLKPPRDPPVLSAPGNCISIHFHFQSSMTHPSGPPLHHPTLHSGFHSAKKQRPPYRQEGFLLLQAHASICR